MRVPKKLTDHEILKRDSTILLCPVCGEKVEQPWGEVISVCKKCHRLLNVTSDEVKVVPYDIARPDMLAEAAIRRRDCRRFPAAAVIISVRRIFPGILRSGGRSI